MDLSGHTRARLRGIAPWSGLIAAGTGWGLHHQLVTDTLHFDCRASADGTGIAWGLLALALVATGAFLSWRALPRAGSPREAAQMRRFIVHMSLMASLLAALGLVFNIVAGSLLPGCQP